MSIRLNSKEQEDLVTKNIRLVYHIVNKLYGDTGDYDEMVSIGTMGLIKAASTFEESKGWKFATYATKCIKNEIFMYFRRDNRYTNVISLEESINEDKDGNELILADMLEDPASNFVEEIAEREILSKYINIILNLLKPKERLVMLYKISNMNQDSISKILNFSQSYISRLESKLENKVKLHFTNQEQFKEVYSMSIVGNSYKISFSSKNVKNFNSSFANFLQNLTSAENLPDFKVSCNKERVIIQVPAHPESFSFIAQIIQQIDDYSLTFISDITTISADNNVSQKGKKDESKEVLEENEFNSDAEEHEAVKSNVPEDMEAVIEEKNQIISDNLSTSTEVDKSSLTDTVVKQKKGDKQKKVEEYILGKETFTVKELKQHFTDMNAVSINNVLQNTRRKGLIISTGKGIWAVKKD